MVSTHYSLFGLDEATFATVADTRFVLKTASFRTVLSQIADGFRNGKTIALVTGKVGTGKTTVCHYLVEKLPLCNRAVITVKPLQTSCEVLAAICDGLNIFYPKKCLDETLILDRLREFLMVTGVRGERTIIIMDEAQNIQYDLVQHLSGLMTSDNPETAKHHFVFAGQLELVEHLETIGFRLRLQENVIRCELAPMNKRDTVSYIRHRVAVGGATHPIFTSAAEATVYRYTNGVSKSINLICDYSLKIAQEYAESLVTPWMVKQAVVVLSPSASDRNLLKRGVNVLTDSADILANGVAHKIRGVWWPRQVKFSRRADSARQEDTLLTSALSLSGASYRTTTHALTEFREQSALGRNKAPVRSFVAESAKSGRASTYADTLDIDAGAPEFAIPDGMVVVPDVTFRSAYSAAEITVAGFLLDQTPLTNKLYARYIEETGNVPPDHWLKNNPPDNLLNHPVVGVSFEDVCGFAEWSGKRLPTAGEWEAAAGRLDNSKFPWGNNWKDAHCNCPESGLNTTTSVDAHPTGRSLGGCLDLVGNVWEWVEDGSDYTDLELGYAWVFGGSYRHACRVGDAIARSMLLRMNRYAYVGFRCAKDLS